ncbi:hypothetical protein EMCRGX_G033075 [Ephydatia muelleri]
MEGGKDTLVPDDDVTVELAISPHHSIETEDRQTDVQLDVDDDDGEDTVEMDEGLRVPSFTKVKNFKMPDFVSPTRCLSPQGLPFYYRSISSVISQCLGTPKLASSLIRFPVESTTTYTEIYHGKRWNSEPRFAAPMVSIAGVLHVFVKDCVTFLHPQLGPTRGIIDKIYHRKDLGTEVLVKVDTLLDANQFKFMVPNSCLFYLPDSTLILYEQITVVSSAIVCVQEKPLDVVRWNRVTDSFQRFSPDECASYLATHPLKAKAAGRKVVMLPLILFADDTSGNKSKKWHKFESWYLLLAGLPRHMNAKVENIHFLCSSDSMSALDMANPIADELILLEGSGLEVYDALHNEHVLVIAPILLFIADNPMASLLLNHLGGSAIKYCRICMADRDESPDIISAIRTLQDSLQQMVVISSQRTQQLKDQHRTLYGVREDSNPLLHIPGDAYRCFPLELLHTLLLGPVKYFLIEVMATFSKAQKEEILARMKAFNFSGFHVKVHGNVCYHHKSFVGRDYKAWSQMALFIISPYLTEGQQKVLLALSKVFRIAYCDFFDPAEADTLHQICVGFVHTLYTDAVKVLKTFTIHMKYKGFFNSIPSKLLNADREIYKPGTARMATSYNGKLNLLKVHATIIDGTILELQQLETPYSVITHLGSMDDNVQEYRAVVSNCSELVHSGDYVELHPPFCEFKYGQLLTTIQLKSGRTLCLVQGFLALQLPNGQPLFNDFECPLFTLSRTLFTVDSTRIQKAVSMVHECGNHCKFEKSVVLNTVEREQVADTKLVFLHDWTQLLLYTPLYREQTFRCVLKTRGRMACKSQPELPELNILNCLERDQWDLLHPSRLTKKFIDGGLSTAQCMHSRDIRGHHGCVNAVEFSNNDEDLLMTGGDDRRILLWRTCELIEGKHRSVAMEGLHESNIFSLAFSSNNAYAYSAGNDGVVKKHDIRSTKCIQEHTYGDMPAIYCLSANPSSPDVILSASEDGAVSLIDTRLPTGLARNVVIQSRSSYQSVCFNPVESNLLAVGNSVFGAALYDLRMNKKLLAYDPTWYSQYRQDVVSVRFDWSGTRLLTLQREFPPTVFNIHENRALYQLIDDTGAYSNSVTMKSGCFLGHNDEYVASGSDDFRCFIWRIPHGGTLEKGRGTTLVPHLVLPGHRSIVNQVRYSSVHHLLCSSGVEKVFKLWSHLPLLANDKIQWSKAPPPRRRYSHLAFLDMWDEGRDTSEEDDHVLAFFDALIEQEGMMNSHPDDSNSSSSSSPPPR